jgi:hypothetical protein
MPRAGVLDGGGRRGWAGRGRSGVRPREDRAEAVHRETPRQVRPAAPGGEGVGPIRPGRLGRRARRGPATTTPRP